MKRRSFRWFLRNSELEGTWISLIGWPQKTPKVALLPFHSLTCMPQGTFFPETNRGRKSHYSELRQPILGKATKQQWKRPIWFGYIFRQITAWSVTLVCFKLCYGFILSHLETNRGRKGHLAIMKKAWWHTRRGSHF